MAVPEKTEAQKKAQKKYMEKFMVAQVRMERGKYERIQNHAATCGQSVNAYINGAIDSRIGTESPQEPAEATPGAGMVSLPSDTIKTAQKAAQNAGETVPQFIERAVDTQAKRDKTSLALGINPATGGKLEKEA